MAAEECGRRRRRRRYVVVDELIPESHARGDERDASLALVVGFALMMALDNAFG